MRRREFIAVLGSAAAAWPVRARAQQPKTIPQVGCLWSVQTAKDAEPYLGALAEGFARLGYVDGRNIKIEYRFATTSERHKALAAELVSLNVDVLMGGATSTPYLRDATTRIPIVFMFVPDPVAMKLVQSIARPGGNITGLANFGRDVAGKRMQLLKEIVPGLSRVALLVNPNEPTARVFVDVTRAAADQLALVLRTFDARSREEIEPAFDAIVSAGMQAVTPIQGGTVFENRAAISKLALARRLPLCAYSRESFTDGALVAYGVNHTEMVHQAAAYAVKILQGAKPGDLPVEQPTKLELLINLKAAKTLGLLIPPHLLALADEVLE